METANEKYFIEGYAQDPDQWFCMLRALVESSRNDTKGTTHCDIW